MVVCKNVVDLALTATRASAANGFQITRPIVFPCGLVSLLTDED